MAAAITLQELLVRIGADISDYTSGIDEAIRKGKEAESAFSAIGKGLSAVFTVPLAAVGADALKAASQMKEALNIIRVETGATGQQLQSLNSSFKNVFAGVPESAKTVGEAIGALNTRLGLTGEPLEKLSEQMLALAHITHSEIQPIIAASTRAFADWSIATEKQGEALDYLFKVSQGTGINFTRLTELIVQFGAPMRALGFSFEQAATMLGKFEKEGVNMEAVMPGLRRELGNFAKAGIDAATGFKAIIDSIKNAKTDAEGLTLALKVFGQRAATDVFRAIKEGRFDVDALTESFRKSSETIKKAEEDTRTLGDRMKILFHEIDLALAPIGNVLLNSLKGGLDSLKPFIDQIGDLGKRFEQLPQHTQNVVVGLGAIAAAAGPAILALQKLSSIVVKPVINLGSEIASGVTAFGKAISNVVGYVNGDMIGALTKGETMLLRFGQAGIVAGAAIASAFIAFEGLKDLTSGLGALNAALSAALPSWDAFKTSVKTVAIDVVETMRSALGSVGDVIAAIAHAAAAAIPDTVKESVQASADLIVEVFKQMGNEIESKGLWGILKETNAFTWLGQAMRDAGNLVEWFSGRYASMEASVKGVHDRVVKNILDQTKISVEALEELAKRRGIDTRSAQDKATAPKVNLDKLLDPKAAKEAEELANRLQEAWYKAQGGLGQLTKAADEAADRLDDLKKAFAAGNLTGQQFAAGMADAGKAISKYWEAQKVPFNAAGPHELQLAMEGVNREFEDWDRLLDTADDSMFRNGVPVTRLYSQGLREMADAMPPVTAAFDSLRKSWSDLFDNAALDTSIAQKNIDLLKQSVEQLNASLHDSERTEGLKFFGISPHEDLKTLADEAIQHYDAIATSAKSTTVEITQAWRGMVAAQIAANRELSAATIAEYVNLANYKTPMERLVEAAQEVNAQVHQAFGRMEKDLANNIAHWRDWATTIKGVAIDLGKGMLEIFLRQVFKPLEDLAAQSATKIATKLMSGLLGIGGKTGEVVGELGATGGVSALEGLSGAAAPIASTAAGAASTGASAAGTLGSLAGIANIANIANAGISLVSGIVSGVQQAHANNLLGEIEVSTRASKEQLIHIQESADKYWPAMSAIHEFLYTVWHDAMVEVLDDLTAIIGLLSNSAESVGDAISKFKVMAMPVATTAATAPASDQVPEPAAQPVAQPMSASPSTYYTGDLNQIVSALKMPSALPSTGENAASGGPATLPIDVYGFNEADIPALTAYLERLGYRGLEFSPDGTVTGYAPTAQAGIDLPPVGESVTASMGPGPSPYSVTKNGAAVPEGSSEWIYAMRQYQNAIKPTESVTASLRGVSPWSVTDSSGNEVSEGSSAWLQAMNSLYNSQQVAPKQAVESYFGPAVASKVADLVSTGIADDMASPTFTNATANFTGAQVNFSDMQWNPAPKVPSSVPQIPIQQMGAADMPLRNTSTVNIYNPTVDSQSRLDSLVSTLESRGFRA